MSDRDDEGIDSQIEAENEMVRQESNSQLEINFNTLRTLTDVILNEERFSSRLLNIRQRKIWEDACFVQRLWDINISEEEEEYSIGGVDYTQAIKMASQTRGLRPDSPDYVSRIVYSAMGMNTYSTFPAFYSVDFYEGKSYSSGLLLIYTTLNSIDEHTAKLLSSTIGTHMDSTVDNSVTFKTKIVEFINTTIPRKEGRNLEFISLNLRVKHRNRAYNVYACNTEFSLLDMPPLWVNGPIEL